MPLKPAAAERPPASPRLLSDPSPLIPKMLTKPVPESRVKRNLPSELIAVSRFVLPVGSVATIVPGNGVNDPSVPIANPEMVDVAELEV